jgi:hypothetical protein
MAMTGKSLMGVTAGLALAFGWCQSATAASHLFTTPGVSQYAVPSGVISVTVTATGAPGLSRPDRPGGLPDTVTATLAVRSGQRLSVLVGDTAGDTTSSQGGGAPVGGGGASDVRAPGPFLAFSLSDRLVVAAGGGGAGQIPRLPHTDGGAATQTGPGAGGVGIEPGAGGTVGQGGGGAGGDVHHDSVPQTAGGGGGGFFGGGGGAIHGDENGVRYVGGGGNGSSYVPLGGSRQVAPAGSGASVRITENFPPPPDRTRPRLSRLAFSPSSFRAGNYGGAVAARVGARLSFKLSEAATTTFTVERASRRKGRRTVYRKLRGSFKRAGRPGANAFTYTGRLRGRALKPGRYRLLTVTKDGAGNRSRVGRRAFRILR